MPRYKNLQELLISSAAARSHDIALKHIQGSTARQYKYGDLPRLSYQYAQALFAAGVRQGEKVALWADDSPEWVMAFLAALRLGAVIMPLDAAYQMQELLPVLERVNPSLIIVDNRQYLKVAGKRWATVHLGEISEYGQMQNPLHLPSTAAENLAIIALTSGTTGPIKTLEITHANIIANIRALQRRFNVKPADKFLSLLSPSNLLGLSLGLLAPLSSGATVVSAPPRDAQRLLQIFSVENVKAVLGTPPQLERLLNALEENVARQPRSSRIALAVARQIVRLQPSLAEPLVEPFDDVFGKRPDFWYTGLAPASKTLADKVRSFGARLIQTYSISEASSVVAMPEAGQLTDTAGTALDCVQAYIANPDADGKGEIIIKGPSVVAPAAATGTGGEHAGWLPTGDKGSLNGGQLSVHGRIEQPLLSESGVEVFAWEIESRLNESPWIKESCVFSGNAAGAQGLHAVIVPSAALEPRLDKEDKVRDAVIEQMSALPETKRLSGYQLWEHDLPRTAGGEVRLSQLTALYETRRKHKSKKASAKTEDDYAAVCNALAEVMDPQVFKGICPSGSPAFSPEISLTGDLCLSPFARLELARLLRETLAINLPQEVIDCAETVDDLMVAVKSPWSSDTAAAYRRNLVESFPWPKRQYTQPDWPYQDDPWVVAGRMVVGIGLRTCARVYNDFTTTGADRLVIDPPYIIAANHHAHIDVLALLASFPPNLLRHVHPIIEKEHFFTCPFTSALSSYLLNAVPFNGTTNLQHHLDVCKQLLNQHKILLMFPEEGFSPAGQIGKLDPAVAYLSISQGCPIVPAYIDGTASISTSGSAVPKPEPLKISFGLPIYPSMTKPDMQSCRELTERIKQAIGDLASGVLEARQPAGS